MMHETMKLKITDVVVYSSTEVLISCSLLITAIFKQFQCVVIECSYNIILNRIVLAYHMLFMLLYLHISTVYKNS